MLRAMVLSLALALSVAQNATLLCLSWCDSQATASGGDCDHADAPSPGLSTADICLQVTPAVAMLIPDNTRPGSASSQVHDVRFVFPFQSLPFLARRHTYFEPSGPPALCTRPLQVTLRI